MKARQIKVVHAVTSSLSLVLLRGQLRYLQSAGFDAIAVSSPGPFSMEMERESVRHFAVPMDREISPFKDLRSLLEAWRLLRELRPEICNASTPKAGLLMSIAGMLARVPCRVYTLRGLRLETATGWKRRVLTLTERLACHASHRVVCVSQSLRRRVIDLKLVGPEKAVVLAAGSSNGIDCGRFVPTAARFARAAQIRRELKLGDGPVIGFVGRITRDKGVAELVAAFDELRQEFRSASLLLVGDYERGDAIAPEVLTRIDTGAQIVRVPFQRDIAPYYLAMDLLCLPTYREGFPSTVLEAQAAELPVVTTTATGAVDSVLHGKTGLLAEPGSVDGLVAAFRTLLRDPALARAMGKAGRQRAERDFQQERVWSELASLYRELLAESGLLDSPGHDTTLWETPRAAS